MKYSEKTVESTDGIEIYTQSWAPETGAKAAVVIVHGYLEHGGRYTHVGEYLSSQGFSVTAFDCRGHGKSAGIKGYVKSFADYSDDLEKVLENVISESKLPTFVLAHSNGGLIALNHYLGKQQPVNQTRISGLILSSPFLGPADELSTVKVMASKILGTILPKLSLPADDVTPETLTHDLKMIEAHKKDELNLKNFTVGWAQVAMAVQKSVCITEDTTLDMPVLFVYAGDDKVADPTKNKVLAEKLQADDKTVIEKPGEYHEILNEVDRQATFETIRKWIAEHI